MILLVFLILIDILLILILLLFTLFFILLTIILFLIILLTVIFLIILAKLGDNGIPSLDPIALETLEKTLMEAREICNELSKSVPYSSPSPLAFVVVVVVVVVVVFF